MDEKKEKNTLLAANYRLVGTGFQLSAKKLSECEELDEKGCPKKLTAIPLYYLASHAAELFLKSALLKRGVSDKDLKEYDYRHNLEALLKKLLEKDVFISTQAKTIINGLSEQHKHHILRYSKTEEGFVKMASYWPPLDAVFQMLEEIMLTTAISTHGM